MDLEILTGAARGQDCCGDGHRDGEHVHPCLHGRDQPGGAEGLLGCIFPGLHYQVFLLTVFSPGDDMLWPSGCCYS